MKALHILHCCSNLALVMTVKQDVVCRKRVSLDRQRDVNRLRKCCDADSIAEMPWRGREPYYKTVCVSHAPGRRCWSLADKKCSQFSNKVKIVASSKWRSDFSISMHEGKALLGKTRFFLGEDWVPFKVTSDTVPLWANLRAVCCLQFCHNSDGATLNGAT